MTKALTLSDALDDEGFYLAEAYRDKRAGDRVRVKIVVGSRSPTWSPLNPTDMPKVEKIVNRYLPGIRLWEWGGVYVSTVPKGTKLHLGTPCFVKEKRRARNEQAWKLRIIRAAHGNPGELPPMEER